MAAPAIEVADLRKTYSGLRGGRQRALSGLDMSVGAGGVHGFLGPNGAGKTTTIRILLGQVSADGGSVSVLGHSVPARLSDVLDDVGAVVEQPRFFPNFSGRRNLSLLAAVGGLPESRVDEVLEVVGLRPRARDRYLTYSLGMRQRLAIGPPC